MKMETSLNENSIRDLISACGDNPNREAMIDTPKRFLKAMQFLTSGYQQNLSETINGALFTSDMDEMIIVNDIEFHSLCEHHLLPFFGRCHVGYLPKDKVLGLSKIPKIVNLFSRRFQIQENLTEQIAHCIAEVTEAIGVGVVIQSQHMCMTMRGVQKQNAFMTTSKLLGQIRDCDRTRAEFFNLTTNAS